MPLTERSRTSPPEPDSARPREVLWAEVLDYDKDGLADLVVRTKTGDSVFHATSAGSFEELDLGLPRPTTLANAAPLGREGESPATNTRPGREGKAEADQGRSARGSASTSSNSGRRPVGNSGQPRSAAVNLLRLRSGRRWTVQLRAADLR